MEANIVFDNVKAYNVNKFDVKLGQTFKVELIDPPGGIRWFSDNDPVLSISATELGDEATITTTSKGMCEIQLQNQEGNVNKVLYIEVYDNVAATLNPTAKVPVLK
jgi:hypothetical protein